MSEKEIITAKDLYCWKRGYDDYAVKILSALNKIIDGFADLQCWEDIVDSMELSTRTIAERCDKIYNSDELADMEENFTAIRTMLFGDKINYTKLLDVLRDNVDECGWTEEKVKRKREENREKLEEKRRRGKENSEYGRFSNEMPERIKK